LYPQRCAFLIVIEKLLYKHYRNRIRKKLDLMCTTQVCHEKYVFSRVGRSTRDVCM